MMDHDELMAMATKTICELNTLTDAQAQELQSARAENAELKELLHNRAKYAAGLRAEINTARRWARLWKQKARIKRSLHLYFQSLYLAECERHDALEAALEAE